MNMRWMVVSILVVLLGVWGCVSEQPYTTTPQPRTGVSASSGPVSSPGYYPADGPTDEPEKKKGYYEEGGDYNY